jgi:hypothetical protein
VFYNYIDSPGNWPEIKYENYLPVEIRYIKEVADAPTGPDNAPSNLSVRLWRRVL